MTIIGIQDRYFTIPTSWNELSRSQFLRVNKIIFSGTTVLRANMRILRVLMGISRYRFRRIHVLYLEEFLYLAEPFYKTNDLTVNLLPVFRRRYGPESDFDNLTGAEFIFTEAYHSEHLSDQSQKSLNKLIGILYRKSKPDYDQKKNPEGDVRERFNKNLVNYYAGRVASWPDHVKKGIFTWYTGCRISLTKGNPKIFGGGSGEAPQYGMWSIMRNIAEKGNHGTFERIEGMLIKEMMMELNEMIDEAERIKKIATK
jgi:hypothetical protein